MRTRMALLRENREAEHTLYRLFNADDDLLYVGISLMPGNRINEHRRKRWGDEIEYWTTTRYKNQREAKHAERVAITNENPRLNTQRPSPRQRDIDELGTL